MIKIMAKYTSNEKEPYLYEVQKGLKNKIDAYEFLEKGLLLGVLRMMTPGMNYSIFKRGTDKLSVSLTFTNGEISRTEYYLEEY